MKQEDETLVQSQIKITQNQKVRYTDQASQMSGKILNNFSKKLSVKITEGEAETKINDKKLQARRTSRYQNKGIIER